MLLDLNLPKYDGRQLLEQIKSDPDLSHIPVVVLTTSSAEEDILRSYKLHANAYVTKPVDLDQFMEAVRQIDEFFVQVVRLPQHLRGRVELHPHRGAARGGLDVHACAHRAHDRQSPATGAWLTRRWLPHAVIGDVDDDLSVVVFGLNTDRP